MARLIEGVLRCGTKGAHDDCLLGPKPALNAHRKWAGLVRSRAPLFMVFGPAKEWHVYRVTVGPGKQIALEECDESELRYPT